MEWEKRFLFASVGAVELGYHQASKALNYTAFYPWVLKLIYQNTLKFVIQKHDFFPLVEEISVLLLSFILFNHATNIAFIVCNFFKLAY